MQETWDQSLSWEDPLEKGMATHSSSCLENSMDRGDWQATVHGVAKDSNRTEHTQHIPHEQYAVHSPSKNAGVGCSALIQGIFQTQGLNPNLPHCR